jgi:DNA-binding transcriptional LysR family regulator
MSTDLDPTSLRGFVTAVREGSLSRAAAVLGRTQPALSQQIRRLEDVVGERLFRRGPAGVFPTSAGEALLPYAERILSLSAEALGGARRDRGIAGHCGVGLLEDLAATALPGALADFAGLHPGVVLEVMVAPGPAMNEALESGRIQLALGDAGYMRQAARWSTRLPLVWGKAPGLSLAAEPLPLVLFSQPCRWRAPLLATLDAAGRRWRIAFESNSLAAVQAAVRSGLGVAGLLPANLQPGMVAVTPDEGLPPLADVEVGLVRRSGTEGDPVVDAVEGLLRRLS